MNAALRVTLEAMRDELETQQLEIVLAPAREPRHACHMVRVRAGRNPAWYRELCERHSVRRRRPRRRSLPDTAVRRRETLAALARMIAGAEGGPAYGPRLLEAARRYWRRHAADLRERLAYEQEAAA